MNRSTFYLHYNNTSDLLKEATQHILDRFLSYFTVDKESITLRYSKIELKDLLFITPEYLIPYLTFIKDNQRLFKTAVRELGSMGFDKVYEKMFTYIFDPILARFDFPENTRGYVMNSTFPVSRRSLWNGSSVTASTALIQLSVSSSSAFSES